MTNEMSVIQPQIEFFSAINYNDLFWLQELLQDHPDLDVDQPLIGSMTGLHVAAEKGYSSCLQILIAAGADVDKTDELGYTPLMTGIRAGYPLVVAKLIKGKCDCSKINSHGATALHMACHLDSMVTAQLLVTAGAPIYQTDNNGDTPLSISLARENTEVVQTLLLGCLYVDPNRAARTTPEQYPLLHALEKNNFLVGKTLLMCGYRGWAEVRTWLASTAGLNTDGLYNVEREAMFYVQQKSLQPVTLGHACRLVIRKILGYNIWQKSQAINLPKRLEDIVCFRDFYNPPNLNTEYAVYSSFADHSELY